MIAELPEDENPLPPHQAVKNNNSKSNNKKKYYDPAYDDKTIEGLMSYFKFGTYGELRHFLQCVKRY
jgi:hypothetical protein